MVQCEVFEACCESVRGETATQEQTAEWIREELVKRFLCLIFSVVVTGRHGANCKTVIKR